MTVTKVSSAINIEKLNQDIKLFPHIKPITPDMNITFKGVSRTVMLDRYAFKDVKLLTLGVTDLVVVTYKDDPKFPRRGYGIVTEYWVTDGIVKVKLDDQFEGGMEIKVPISKVDKPLELFYEQIADRNARGLADVENPEDFDATYDKFNNILVNKAAVPAGRVLMGAGSEQDVTYFNCYVMPYMHDSRGGIGDHRKKVMEIMSRGGGVGTNGSTLRPRRAFCHGVNGRSSGSVTWLHDLSQLTNLVEQGGSRRGAQMIMLNSSHPDIIEFIISKVQNPRVLRFIIENTNSDLIKSEAERKLNFTPLNPTEKYRLEQFVHNTMKPQDLELYTEAIEEAKSILADGGHYSVHNPDFLTGANISVCFDDDFMEALENETTYRLRFPDVESHTPEQREYYDEHWADCGDVREWETVHNMPVKTYCEIDAQEMWDLINTCATYSAEPGIFFLDNANQMTNAVAYNQKVVATNPCGKIA